jgi:HEAT repeat protein
MGKRASVDDKLSAVRRLRELPPSPETTSELRAALRDKSNLVVATAAAIVGDQHYAELSAELELAFDRFLVDPVKNDKLCRAKIAVIEALNKLEHTRADVFLRAHRHVQLEPVWGGSEDTAAPLRAAAIFGLARFDYHSLLPLLVDSLADSHKDVRSAAVQALGYHGSETASLLLRLKTQLGDKDPEVTAECLSSLLNCSAAENLPFVTQFLDTADEAIQEAATLALGKTRLPEAFALLKHMFEHRPLGPVEEIFLAMAMLRLPAATDFLLEMIATQSERTASKALSALLIYRHDPNLRDRIASAVAKNGSRELQTRLEQALRRDD